MSLICPLSQPFWCLHAQLPADVYWSSALIVISHTEMVKNLFSAQRVLSSPLILSQITSSVFLPLVFISPPRSAAAALLPFSSQTNFKRLSSTADAKCHRVGGGSTRIDHSWFDLPLIQVTGTAMFCQWRGVPSIDSIVRVSVMPFFCFVSDKINRFD